MKINEIFKEDLTSMNLTNKFFIDEDDLKEKINQATDKILVAYQKATQKVHGRVIFSNEVDEYLRDQIFKYMVEKYKIHSDSEISELREAVSKYPSIHYLEYKLNNIIPVDMK